MIVPGRAHIGHIFHYVGRPLVALLAWDVFVTAVYLMFGESWANFPAALPLTLLGSAVAVYLSFRNTTAYARWWEARTLGGALVNHSRGFARELKLLLPPQTDALRRELVHRQIAYIHALRLHLRRQSPWQELAERLSADEIDHLRSVNNVPNAILDRSAQLIAERGGLDSMRLGTIEQSLRELSNAQGGMERIKNTPLPQQYATYPMLFTHAFCLLLPLGLVESLGIYTPLGSTAVGFLFLALLQIGNDMQNPFEDTQNDVPLTALSRAIEIDLLDGLGQPHELKPVGVQHGVLW